MAKLSAYGRTAVITAVKEETIDPCGEHPHEGQQRIELRLMSDGTILHNQTVVWADGRKHSYGWKQVAKLGFGESPAGRAESWRQRGYTVTVL